MLVFWVTTSSFTGDGNVISHILDGCQTWVLALLQALTGGLGSFESVYNHAHCCSLSFFLSLHSASFADLKYAQHPNLPGAYLGIILHLGWNTKRNYYSSVGGARAPGDIRARIQRYFQNQRSPKEHSPRALYETMRRSRHQTYFSAAIQLRGSWARL